MEVRHPRALDHLVLPVVSLDTARRRHEALGFTVAPDARHPFGTENACVFLADGTYLEPLAIGHRETCEAAALAGNMFVMRDQAYRFRNGQDGFSAIALSSEDADGDEELFRKSGISGGDTLTFSRMFDDGKGNKGEASFKLAFAADLRSPDSFFFTCQRINVPKVDRSALQHHSNGVTGMVSIAISEENPSDFQYLLQDAIGQRETSAHTFGLDIHCSNVRIEAFNRHGMRAWFGVTDGFDQRGLRLRAVVFAAPDLDLVRAGLAANHVPFEEHEGRVIVRPVEGQGAIYAFEAVK
jgi:hypothetical protein